MVTPTLAQRLFGIEFKNPVLAASGTFGYGAEFSEFYDVSLLGGFVTKAVTPEPRTGNPAPRIVETPSGMLNAIGLQNEGLDAFLDKTVPRLAEMDTAVIVNVAGRTMDDYVHVVAALDRVPTVRAFELNISCPNVREGGIAFGSTPDAAAHLTGEVRGSTSKPLIVKLSPNVSDIASIARAVEQAGADGISLINTLTGMVVDVRTRRPMLANVTGGLSGPAIRPVAIRMVWQAAREVKIPVIGMGGIFSARDALEFIIAGASLVEVGSGMFVKPRLPLEVIDGIRAYLADGGFQSVTDIIGSIRTPEE